MKSPSTVFNAIAFVLTVFGLVYLIVNPPTDWETFLAFVNVCTAVLLVMFVVYIVTYPRDEL